jgi:hypothetical protein
MTWRLIKHRVKSANTFTFDDILAQDRDQRRAPVNMALNLQVP